MMSNIHITFGYDHLPGPYNYVSFMECTDQEARHWLIAMLGNNSFSSSYSSEDMSRMITKYPLMRCIRVFHRDDMPVEFREEH